MTKQVWFIRHAESMTNVGETWTDHASNPITDNGHQQAIRVCEVLTDKPSLIVTSSYTRTKETAAPTLKKWSDVEHEEWDVHEFATFCYKKHGKVTGALWSENAYNLIEKNDPDYKDGETAESYTELMGRVDNTIEKIHASKHDKIIIFSHGFFLGILFIRLGLSAQPIPSIREMFERRRQMHIPNTSISHFSFLDTGETEFHSISTDHLSETEVALKGA